MCAYNFGAREIPVYPPLLRVSLTVSTDYCGLSYIMSALLERSCSRVTTVT